jgi:pyruvate dehydrogenase E1 component beta subunit
MTTPTIATASAGSAPKRPLSYREALREAMRLELARDPDVFLMGEDIGHPAASTR